MARLFDPPHPGELLREFHPEGMTIEEVAGRFGVSRVQLSRVLNGTLGSLGRYGHPGRIADEYDTRIVAAGQTKWDLWQASQKPLPAVEPFRRAA